MSAEKPINWPIEDPRDGRGFHFKYEKRQIPDSSLNWPIEDPLDGRGFRFAREENSIPPDYIKRNQSFWRKAQRGIFSRPAELGMSATFLHRRIVETFNLENAQESILVWSTLFDKPKTPSSEFVYAERFPSNIKEEDRQYWTAGMVNITEFATNYATREFFKKNADLPIARSIAEVYGELADMATYKIMIGGTYYRMHAIEEQAVLSGKDFKAAIFKALFQHDFNPINSIISDTSGYSGCSNIDELAIQIGKNRFRKPDLGKWLGKLEIGNKDGKIKSNLKNSITSLAAGGVYRNPGVTEISGAIPSLFYLETGAVSGLELSSILKNPHFSHILSSFQFDSLFALATSKELMASLAPIFLIYPFIAVHESIHSYSSNKEFMGLLPARIVRREKTPGLIALEPARRA